MMLANHPSPPPLPRLSIHPSKKLCQAFDRGRIEKFFNFRNLEDRVLGSHFLRIGEEYERGGKKREGGGRKGQSRAHVATINLHSDVIGEEQVTEQEDSLSGG